MSLLHLRCFTAAERQRFALLLLLRLLCVLGCPNCRACCTACRCLKMSLTVPVLRFRSAGKTAAFVIPLIEKLKAHSARAGARAVILSPTRELALQAS